MVTQYYTASSVDGFIADPDNSLSWLLSRDIDEHGPMGYAGVRAGWGAMCMGATTYQWIVDNHDDGWPYSMPCWVFTHRDFPPRDGDIRFTSAPIADVHAEMVAAAGGKNVWVVGGGDLVGQFHDAGLLDEVWVQYAPVTLGGGAPMLPRRIELRLTDLAQNRDFACARYDVVRESATDGQ
ncbi:dihydrofolate reductase family protein [Nocardioides terrisoli]|uniref:dihydrofolate reductase family protein n=1 Tax=Nocardioides terrisoli TaxID=3388267 RepID=UPI00287B6061|nr:dihydrofolate reductase family protein [Nocardioides marmorisolisilvae]